MLDVHAPEHTPHSVRDFFLHIFTITIGLLIALGLESLVEWRHHVHLGHEAAANIRRELDSNRKEVQLVLAAVPQEQQGLKDLADLLKQREAGKPTNLKRAEVGFTLATLRDASWQTASATGALTYIPYDEAQRFAEVYQLQKQFDALQSGALQPGIALQGTISTGDPNNLSSEDAKAAAVQVHTVMASIEAIREVGVGLDKSYDDALHE